MGYTHVSEADRDEIWKLRSGGLNANEISKQVGRSYFTVATILKESGGIRPETKSRSDRALTLGEREEISRGLRGKETFTEIAAHLQRSISTVSREVGRNGGRAQYRAVRADKAAGERACRPKASKLAVDATLCEVVAAKLKLQWSPQQISAWLETEYPDDASMRISHESIYLSIYRRNAGLASDVGLSLRTRRIRRRPRRKGRRERRGTNPNMTLIRHRPSEADDRATPGHWEGDLIFGRGHRRAIGTVVERTSRFLFLLDLVDGYPTQRVCDLLAEQLGAMPAGLAKSLTWDQGTEMSGHQVFTACTGIPVYFCDPRSPWQRPTNENTNGLLRNYFAKGVDLRGVTRSDLDRVALELNTRPRRTLEWLTPAARYAQLCALTP